MVTNDIKKGQRVRLSSGFFGTITDNKKGNVRECRVEGIFEETGGVYSHEIVAVQMSDGSWERVEHNDKQKALREALREIGW